MRSFGSGLKLRAMGQNKGQKNNVGICRLCLQERELRNSHIIPEFLYKPSYDDKHRAIDVNTNKFTVKYAQKGIYERLLCDVCEGDLNVLETYFSKRWYGEDALPRNLVEYRGKTLCVKVDYARFKLFHLSVLWRANVSSLPEFSKVNLGPHEENVRQMVLALEPGQQHNYGIVGAVLLDNEGVMHDLIGLPVTTKLGLYRIYMLIFGGCRWYYSVASPNVQKTPNALERNGDFTLIFESFLDSPDITAIRETLRKQPNTSLYVDDVIQE